MEKKTNKNLMNSLWKYLLINKNEREEIVCILCKINRHTVKPIRIFLMASIRFNMSYVYIDTSLLITYG